MHDDCAARRSPKAGRRERGAQGAEVRRLKEEEGLTKKDPRLSEAVAELLRLKALLPQYM